MSYNFSIVCTTECVCQIYGSIEPLLIKQVDSQISTIHSENLWRPLPTWGFLRFWNLHNKKEIVFKIKPAIERESWFTSPNTPSLDWTRTKLNLVSNSAVVSKEVIVSLKVILRSRQSIFDAHSHLCIQTESIHALSWDQNTACVLLPLIILSQAMPECLCRLQKQHLKHVFNEIYITHWLNKADQKVICMHILLI